MTDEQELRLKAFQLAMGIQMWDDEGRLGPLPPTDLLTAAKTIADFVTDATIPKAPPPVKYKAQRAIQ